MKRGYACIGLKNPKVQGNVGSILRIAYNFDTALVAIEAPRTKIRESTDTMKCYRHKPVVVVKDLFDVLPFDCVPVAVDLVDGAENLLTYRHPERAFYIFGAEDQTLGASVINRCRDVIQVPTKYCMNLAVSAGVIMYDRMLKEENQ